MTRLITAARIGSATLGLATGVFGTTVVGAQEVATPAADSVKLAQSVAGLELERASAQAAGVARANEVLNRAVEFAPRSTALSEEARELLRAKGWLLWFNPSVRLIVQPTADSGLNDGEALAQARARVDSIRAFLATRGVEVDRGRVQSAPGAPRRGTSVGCTVSGPISVWDVPPTSAEPPTKDERTGRPLSDYSRWNRWGVVRIFYATDRGRTGKSAVEDFYSGDRSPSSSLEFGRIEVTVPRVHRAGNVERPAWYQILRNAGSGQFMAVKKLTPLSPSVALDSIRAVVASSGSKEALVFIHGYNVSFNDAALRTAQLTYDIGFDGAPILYSWPSKASLWRYSADRDASEWSADHLRDFLESVVAITGKKRVNVVAHSMGNRALLLALEGLGRAGRDTLLGNVVLAAADFDVARFQTPVASVVRPLAQRVTVYMSAKDWALRASKALAANVRLGEAVDPVPVIAGVDLVDASEVRTDLLGHGYIASSAILLDDLAAVLNQKLQLPRKLRSRVSPAGGQYWSFP
jgi:esterase/lipase superfamily enzyme